RLAILKVHTKRVNLATDVDLEVIARGTPGFVGADLQNLVNESALLAARREETRVGMSDFERAKDKVLMGAERRSMIMSDEEKRSTAFHEAGHALVALLTPHSDPVHKVTIIPRGMALGLTQTLPEEDRYSYTREQMVALIKYAMGGRAAEELVFSHFSTGASNDLQRATRIARDMVCNYGMSDVVGPVSYDDEHGDIFLGRDYMQRKNYSEKTAELIDEEVKKLLSTLYEEARSVLAERRDALDRIALALLERETLEGAELQLLIHGKALPPMRTPPISKTGPPPERVKAEPSKAFPGEKLPDPEPVPG
ncbi:MAG TPA: cell division protein FtsH, partial [Myxococcota bacterium]|nr:cell division protein FtsH [Myxococcota bacterium]